MLREINLTTQNFQKTFNLNTMKKLYLIWQEVNNNYDTYNEAIVCANSEDDARNIDPGCQYNWRNNSWHLDWEDGTSFQRENDHWCNPKDVKVKEIGVANDSLELGAVCSSFNAG